MQGRWDRARGERSAGRAVARGCWRGTWPQQIPLWSLAALSPAEGWRLRTTAVKPTVMAEPPYLVLLHSSLAQDAGCFYAHPCGSFVAPSHQPGQVSHLLPSPCSQNISLQTAFAPVWREGPGAQLVRPVLLDGNSLIHHPAHHKISGAVFTVFDIPRSCSRQWPRGNWNRKATI